MSERLFPDDAASAVISDSGLYRYQLTRRWDDGPQVTFVMCNPSTADAHQDDPTIRRCIGFAKRFGCSGLVVANLFAYRATFPSDLRDAAEAGIDIWGPDNEAWIEESMAASSIGFVVVAWGASIHRARYLTLDVEPIAARVGVELRCLGRTRRGDPRHPLMLPADTQLEPWGG